MSPHFLSDFVRVNGAVNFQIIDLNDRFARPAMQVQKNRVHVGVSCLNVLLFVAQLVSK